MQQKCITVIIIAEFSADGDWIYLCAERVVYQRAYERIAISHESFTSSVIGFIFIIMSRLSILFNWTFNKETTFNSPTLGFYVN